MKRVLQQISTLLKMRLKRKKKRLLKNKYDICSKTKILQLTDLGSNNILRLFKLLHICDTFTLVF